MTPRDYRALSDRMRGGEVCRIESEASRILRPHIEALGQAFETERGRYLPAQ
jgi:hypothetical protein